MFKSHQTGLAFIPCRLSFLPLFRVSKLNYSLAFFLYQIGQGEDVLKGSQIAYVTGVEGEDVISAQVATVTQSGLGQQVALISQDGTQHVSKCFAEEVTKICREFRLACLNTCLDFSWRETS